MHPNDLTEFRDNIANPRLLQLFEKTSIPEAARYIDKLEFSSLDGRNCGFDSRIQASGLCYHNGRAEEYVYDECDVELADFFAEHQDCVFISDGSLRIYDELAEMDLSTRIRNMGACDRFFHWFESPKDFAPVLTSIEYEKLCYLKSSADPAKNKADVPMEDTVWICVYKDVLGYLDEFDNLVDILVPTDWLAEQLRKEGESIEGWFDEYTADSTMGIAAAAKTDGVILDCTDPIIAAELVHKPATLDSLIQNAQNRTVPPSAPHKAPSREPEF